MKRCVWCLLGYSPLRCGCKVVDRAFKIGLSREGGISCLTYTVPQPLKRCSRVASRPPAGRERYMAGKRCNQNDMYEVALQANKYGTHTHLVDLYVCVPMLRYKNHLYEVMLHAKQYATHVYTCGRSGCVCLTLLRY